MARSARPRMRVGEPPRQGGSEDVRQVRDGRLREQRRAHDRQGGESGDRKCGTGRDAQRRAGTAVDRPVQRPGRAHAEQRQRSTSDDLIRADPDDKDDEQQCDHRPCSNRTRKAERYAVARRSHERSQGTGQDRALQADVDQSRTLDEQLAKGREREGHGRTNRGGEEGFDDVRHAAIGVVATSVAGDRRRRAPTATTARISAASITVTRVEGTPASRCMAPAPASRPPINTAVAATRHGSSPAKSATAMAV